MTKRTSNFTENIDQLQNKKQKSTKTLQTDFEEQQEEEISFLSIVDQNIVQNIFMIMVNGYHLESNEEEELKIILNELLNFQITCKLFFQISNQILFPLILHRIEVNLHYKKYFKIKFIKQKVEKDKRYELKNINDLFYETCILGYHDLINTLLKYGANIDTQHRSTKITPLMEACVNENVKTIQKLIKKELDINLRNILQDTALILSCYREREGSVSLLLSRKDIDINLKQNQNKTALDIAKEINHFGIVEMLLNYQN